MMEEQTKTELELQVSGLTLGNLTTNAKTILEVVRAKLEGYKPENYSEDNIQAAKTDKAELNNAAKKLNDERIRLEKEFMKPFDEFKGIVAETCTLITQASSQIDKVVKAVDDREKQAKRAEIEKYFASTGCQYFTLDRIFNQSWLNKTVKMKVIESEIRDRITKTESDLGILERVNEPEAKVYYLNTLDLNRSLAEADRIKQNRERLAKIEQNRAQVIQNTVQGGESPAQNPVQAAQAPTQAPMQTADVPAEKFTVALRITGTRAKLEGLKEYIVTNGLTYEKI